MNAISNLLQSTCRAIGFGSEIIGYTVSFGQSPITPKAVLAAESPLAMCTQRIEDKKAPRPRFSAAFRPIAHKKPKPMSGPTNLISIPVLGGLHHRYVRVAA